MRRWLPLAAVAVVGAAVLAACNDEAAPTPIPPATPVLSATIDVTRQDYEMALAKWQSKNISDYQITIYELSLRVENDQSWVVRSHDHHLQALKYPWSDKPLVNPTFGPTDDDYAPSIDELFDLTDSALKYTEQADSLPMVYSVKFDPIYGYPTYYDQGCYGKESPPQKVCPSDTFLTYRVTEFQALKQP